MKKNLIDKVLLEWSYRCDKGYPVWGDVNDMRHLQSILEEKGIELTFKRVTITKHNIINEAEFTPADLAKDKYLNGFINNVSKLSLPDEKGIPLTVIVKLPLYKVFVGTMFNI